MKAPIAPELTTSRHFWRGVVDGDGSIFILKTGYSSINLVGSQRLLEAFLPFLTERNLSGRMTIRPHKSIHGFSTAGYLADLIIDELYRNATTALDRKAAAAAPIIESERARRIQAAAAAVLDRRQRTSDQALI